MCDLQFMNCGSFATVTAVSERGLEWIEDNIRRDAGPDARPEVGLVVYIEHRHLEDIVLGARADGLVCEG